MVPRSRQPTENAILSPHLFVDSPPDDEHGYDTYLNANGELERKLKRRRQESENAMDKRPQLFNGGLTTVSSVPARLSQLSSGSKRTFSDYRCGQKYTLSSDSEVKKSDTQSPKGQDAAPADVVMNRSDDDDNDDFLDYLRTPRRKELQNQSDEMHITPFQYSTKSLPSLNGEYEDSSDEDYSDDSSDEPDVLHESQVTFSSPPRKKPPEHHNVPAFDPNQRYQDSESQRLEEVGGIPVFECGILSDNELREFKHFCMSYADKNSLDLDGILEIIHEFRYNIYDAKEWVMRDPNVIRKKQQWSDQERHLVDTGFMLYGKQLPKIYRKQLQARGSTKTMGDLVNLYYQNKHRAPFPEQDLSRFVYYQDLGNSTIVRQTDEEFDSDDRGEYESEEHDDAYGRFSLDLDPTLVPTFTDNESSVSSFDYGEQQALDFPVADFDPMRTFDMSASPIEDTDFMPPISSVFQSPSDASPPFFSTMSDDKHSLRNSVSRPADRKAASSLVSLLLHNTNNLSSSPYGSPLSNHNYNASRNNGGSIPAGNSILLNSPNGSHNKEYHFNTPFDQNGEQLFDI